jgi:urea transporter
MIGILVGKPSIWQYVRAGEYSWVAAAIVALGLARALWQVANRRTIPDYWLFFLLVGWVPLLAMGMFGWYFPPRYTEFALLPVLLTAVACCQQWVSTLPAVRSLASPARRHRKSVGSGALRECGRVVCRSQECRTFRAVTPPRAQ